MLQSLRARLAFLFAGTLVLATVTGGDLLFPGAGVLGYRDTGNLDGSGDLYPPSF